jgi:hypothetical protein
MGENGLRGNVLGPFCRHEAVPLALVEEGEAISKNRQAVRGESRNGAKTTMVVEQQIAVAQARGQHQNCSLDLLTGRHERIYKDLEFAVGLQQLAAR